MGLMETVGNKVKRKDFDDLHTFRVYVRTWLTAYAPAAADSDDSQTHPLDRDAERVAVAHARKMQAKLFGAGLTGLVWPKEYGGQDLTAEHQRAFAEEAAEFDLGTRYFNIAFGMVGPTILELGTESQKHDYIPKMLRGEHTWCQLFSEPGAGSDVASVQTRATLDGDEWAVNGQKVWISGAHRADLGALLARTNLDRPKHQGLTMLILPMSAPGVTVRPLYQITGESQFNEAFFDDVRIPAENVIGEVNEGWHAAVAMLMNERVAIGAARGGNDVTAGTFSSLLALARHRVATSDPVVRQRLAEAYSLERVLGFVRQRTQAAVKSGRSPGSEGSIAKLLTTELLRLAGEVGASLAGPDTQAWVDSAADGNRWSRATMASFIISIGGGTNEIQRNIIGERMLGLPKEPQVDRDIPFRDLKVGTQRAQSADTRRT